MPRYIFRLGDIPFSKKFIRTLRNRGVIISRRNEFGRSAVLINHGNHHPIKVKSNVQRFYVINKPDWIRYCSSKSANYNVLKDFYPKTYNHWEEVNKFPVILKRPHGFQGRSVMKIDSKTQLRNFMRGNNGSLIIQDYIPVLHEYRFNVLDGKIYQVSRKEMLEGYNGKFKFEWKSLGTNAKLHNSTFKFVEDAIKQFHKKVGSNLGSYCVDVIKSKDKKGRYLSEFNSGYGIGEFTVSKLMDLLDRNYHSGKLEKYRVR
jgi:glutathione synthase/RimK-type ligase-like ATP-grasp enzyme